MEMVHFIPPSQRRLTMMAAQDGIAPVLISGANGTGKGAIARWIHDNGPRAGRPLVVADHDISLAAQIPAAQGGTILIPEVGEWTLSEQKLLLDFLETRSVTSLTDPTAPPMIVNARVIAATDQALDGRALGGLFNIELLDRLSAYRVDMPPLRDRSDEFEDLALAIVGEAIRELHKEHLRGISPEAWLRLGGYDWPGNIRELRNVLKLAVAQAAGDRIEASDLPEFGPDRTELHATRDEFERLYRTATVLPLTRAASARDIREPKLS